MPSVKRVAIYLRQSQVRDGTGYGVDRQREDVERLVISRGWQVAAEFVDNDVSALSSKPRLQFTEMMRRVDAGEFDVIAARHMDRLLRRLAELEQVLERCKKTKTAIVTAADGVDTSTDRGRLVARILSSVAQGEVERKGARQRSAAVQAAKQGRWIGGRRAFGYDPTTLRVLRCIEASGFPAPGDLGKGFTGQNVAIPLLDERGLVFADRYAVGLG
jgi:site-specific DNA recombinase